MITSLCFESFRSSLILPPSLCMSLTVHRLAPDSLHTSCLSLVSSFYTFFFFLPFLFIVSPNDGWLISPLSTLPACLPACLLWVGAIKVPSLIMPSSSSNVFLLEKWIELRGWSMGATMRVRGTEPGTLHVCLYVYVTFTSSHFAGLSSFIVSCVDLQPSALKVIKYVYV